MRTDGGWRMTKCGHPMIWVTRAGLVMDILVFTLRQACVFSSFADPTIHTVTVTVIGLPGAYH